MRLSPLSFPRLHRGADFNPLERKKIPFYEVALGQALILGQLPGRSLGPFSYPFVPLEVARLRSCLFLLPDLP